MNNKIQKITSIMLMLALVVGCFAVMPLSANAAANQTLYLKGSGTDFDEQWNNVFYLGNAETDNDPNIWHLVYTGKNITAITEMQLTFTNDEVFNWLPNMGFSTNDGGNNPGWVIIAPYDWELDYVNSGSNNESGCFVITTEEGNLNFNISGYHSGSSSLGSLEITVNAQLEYTIETLQPVWQKVYQPIWQKVYQPIWQKTQQPIWQKSFQPVYVPQFTKDVSFGGNDTLVTRLTYSDDTINAVPTNGGTFKNGHTYVEVNVADASTESGVSFGIADSSMNSNGKKTPSEYNIPINYEYNVKIVDDALTISFDDRLISASVGAYAIGALVLDKNGMVDADKSFPGNAPQHYSNSVTVDVPVNDGTIYLYFHLAGGLTWYTTGEYEFAGWTLATNDLVSDALVRNELVSDEKAETKLVMDTLIYNNLVQNSFVRNDVISSETVLTNDYDGVFDIVVKNADNEIVGSGQVSNSEPFTLDNLAIGDYTVILSGNDVDVQQITVTVEANNTVTANFDNITVQGETQEVYLDKIYLKAISLDKIYLKDITLPKIYRSAIYLDKIYLDDLTLEATYHGSENPEDIDSIAYGIYTPAI